MTVNHHTKLLSKQLAFAGRLCFQVAKVSEQELRVLKVLKQRVESGARGAALGGAEATQKAAAADRDTRGAALQQ